MTLKCDSVVLVQQGTGFGWDEINFFHNNSYVAMFCICDENSVDNTPMFSLSLTSVKAFSASHHVLLARKLGMHEKSRGDTAGTADPS